MLNVDAHIFHSVPTRCQAANVWWNAENAEKHHWCWQKLRKVVRAGRARTDILEPWLREKRKKKLDRERHEGIWINDNPTRCTATSRNCWTAGALWVERNNSTPSDPRAAINMLQSVLVKNAEWIGSFPLRLCFFVKGQHEGKTSVTTCLTCFWLKDGKLSNSETANPCLWTN